MLKKLGRQLTILNVVISGAILIAMAALALNVTERMMVTKNENELRSQLSMVVSAIGTPDEDPQGMRVKLALPEKYLFYADNTDARQLIYGTATVSDDDAHELLTLARERISDNSTQLEFVSTPSDSMEVISTFIFKGDDEGEILEKGEPVHFLQQRFYSDDASDDSETQFEIELVLNQSADQPPAQATEYTPYRVAALGDAEASNMVIVMQDISEELLERDKLRVQFAICVLFALVLIVLSSLFFSSKAVAPVEAMIKKQREFVAAASHELRTPIASVRANAEVLGDANLGDYEPYLKSIQGEGEKMTRLVSDLLSLARLDADESKLLKAPVDVAEVACDVLEMIAPLAQKREIRLESAPGAGVMLGNADRLRQVMVALMDNAVRYTPSGGMVRLSTGHKDQRAWILIEDSGPGIPDAQKQRAFERFYRLDTARSRDHGGSGLGLSIAKELVESMDGKITLKDRMGGGCSFLIEFPRLS